ncbi:MAG TPA: PQQ-binding-like beta-propeller repeat protein [Chitinophagaceae bacterium]
MTARNFFFVMALTMVISFSYGQTAFHFAHISDTHIGSNNAEEDLRRTVQNINNDSSIKFVILSGDITDFGSDAEFLLAKQILDSLNKPWYIIPGNHDSGWSESGTNSFKKIFGSETFSFMYGGYLFLGTVCGPNMRMSPGQVSRENILWLESELNNLKDKAIPVIYINHYPIDTSLNNWFEVMDRLKKTNIQLILCGHGHSNRVLNFEGIPGIMGRSNLRARNPVGGYNVVTIKDGVVTYEERNPVTNEQKQWAQVKLHNYNFSADTVHYSRPSYAINARYKNVKITWQFKDESDIGSGAAITKDRVVVSNSNGSIYALNIKNGKKIWSFTTNGKIYSTPAIEGELVVAASTDHNIYCVNTRTGKLIWKFETQKPIVANALIKNKTVYIGSSDGHFRAIDINNGHLKWDFNGVKGFVVTTPLFYNNKIYFGSWGTEFYAVDAETGSLVWKWNNGSSNRMFSPAACYPVATGGKVFIVAPDRYMTVFDAETGKVTWRKNDPANRVRESMGLSKDSTLIYSKTMEGELIGISTSAPDMNITWRSGTALNYEIAPTAIVEFQNTIYVPSNSGVVAAVNRIDGSILWKHKISNALITSVVPVAKTKLLVTSMDGKVTLLEYKP